MVSAKDFCTQCRIPLQEGWGYIWGTYGQLWTASSRITSKAPANSKSQAAKYGSKWIGKRVSDCSGLLYWASKQLGFSLPHGANTMFNSYCKSKGKINSDTVLRPGYAVFLYDGRTRHHVGVFVGNDTVIEAKGTQYGVVTSTVSNWDEWGELKGIDYSGEADEPVKNTPSVSQPTLRKGSNGDAVKKLQQALGEYGYALSIDGVYGSGTESAVINFQQNHNLTADGVCGPLTWAALNNSVKNQVPDVPVIGEPSVETEMTDTEFIQDPANWDPADEGMVLVDVNDLDWSETEEDGDEDVLTQLVLMRQMIDRIINKLKGG